MDHETEVIKDQMRHTRTALTEKLEALEDRVASTVRETTEAVGETVEAVKDAVENTVHSVTDTVSETVENVKESVKETFDISRQVENHPWAMLGGSVLLGYLGGCLLGRVSSSNHAFNGRSAYNGYAGQPEAAVAPMPEQRSGPSLWDQAREALGPPLHKLEGLAIGAAAGVVGNMVLNAAPESLRQELEQVINELTTSLGGKLMPDLLRREGPGQPSDQPATAPL